MMENNPCPTLNSPFYYSSLYYSTWRRACLFRERHRDRVEVDVHAHTLVVFLCVCVRVFVTKQILLRNHLCEDISDTFRCSSLLHKSSLRGGFRGRVAVRCLGARAEVTV